MELQTLKEKNESNHILYVSSDYRRFFQKKQNTQFYHDCGKILLKKQMSEQVHQIQLN